MTVTGFRSPTASAACALAGLLAWAAIANAQTARSGGAPNAQLLQQLQQLGSEKTALAAENDKMKKELDDLRKERDQLKKGHEATDQRVRAGEAALARSNAQRESTEQELTQTKAKMRELIAKFQEVATSMRDVETANTANQQMLATRDRELRTCVDRNLALYKLNDEVLTRLDQQGFWSRAAQAEPFTRIKRVQLENLVDEYKQRADEQRAPAPSALPETGATTPLPPRPAATP